MKTIQVLTGIPLLPLLTTTSAWAGTGAGGTRVYSSGLLVAVFIGICALVVLVQMIPALVTMWGMFKGVGKEDSKDKRPQLG
jgi:hypothetical protein